MKHMRTILYIFATAIVIYHMIQTINPLWDPWYHRNMHLALALVLVFLASLLKNPKRWPVTLGLIVLSIATTAYMGFSYEDLQMRAGFPTQMDTVVGTLIIIVVLEACRRTAGWSLVIVALLFISYGFIGNLLPPPFYVARYTPIDIIARLTTSLEGIYGRLISISAYYIFLFVIMGGIMQVTAAPRFFNSMGSAASRTLRGGPGLTSVISSALLGTTLGSSSANTAITGAFTIPAMKRAGYAPHEAGAIESAASTGGQIMPPVMGAAAFVMSNFTGIAYGMIILAAAVPAILYFFSVGAYVQLTALKRNIKPADTLGEVKGKELLLSAPAFLAPLTVIVILFVNGFTPTYVAVWAVITCIVFGFLRRGKPLSLKEWGAAFYNGATVGAIIAITIATVSIVVEMIVTTGIGVKFPLIIETWSGGNITLALLLVGASSIILGMGVPTTAAYIIVALVGAPVLVQMGVPLLSAHLFVFYLAVMSMVTPPVAPAAVIGAQMAGAGYLKTAVESAKVAIAGFAVPFIFVFSPVFILRPEGTLSWIITSIVSGLLVIISAQVGIVNFFFTDLNRLERILYIICAIAFFAYVVVLPSYTVFAAAIIIFAILTIIQIRKRRSGQVATAIAAEG